MNTFNRPDGAVVIVDPQYLPNSEAALLTPHEAVEIPDAVLEAQAAAEEAKAQAKTQTATKTTKSVELD